MTTTTLWIDAAYAANTAQLQAAWAAGARGCGYYLPGEGVGEDPLNQWTPAQVAAARAVGFRMVPIWVPKPSLPADPVDSANRAFAAAKACGSNPKLSGLYTGNHLEQTGQITGPIWIPAPGAEPTSVGSQSAVQWGTVTFAGWNVDENVAASDFPWETVIMVDFEYNTTAGAAGVAWYKAFQSRITQLAKPVVPTPPPPPTSPGGHVASKALPTTAYPVQSASGDWATPSRYDVVMVGNDGHVYHKWYEAGSGWNGPDILDGPV